VVELADDGKREDVDLRVARRAVAPPLGVMIAADRRRTGDAGNAGFLECLACGRLMGIQPPDRVALGNDPAAGVARSDQQSPKRAIRFSAIGQGGDLVDGRLPFCRCVWVSR
jgi:hypothetical protein